MHPAISIAPQIPRSSFRLFYESQDAANFAVKFVQICPNCHFCDYTTSFCTLCSSYLYQILCVFVVARPLSFLHPSPLEFGQICPNRITHLPNSLIARLFFASFDLECRDSQSKSYRSPPDSTCVWLHDPLLHSLAFVRIVSLSTKFYTTPICTDSFKSYLYQILCMSMLRDSFLHPGICTDLFNSYLLPRGICSDLSKSHQILYNSPVILWIFPRSSNEIYFPFSILSLQIRSSLNRSFPNRS